MDEHGQFISTKSLGPLEASWCKITISGDSLLLTGNIGDPNDFGKHYNICIDTALNIIWQRKVSGGANTYMNVGRNAVLTNDGGYAHVTTRQGVANGLYHLTVIKGDNLGNAQCYENNLNLTIGSFTWIEISDSVVRPYTVNVSPMNVLLDTIDVVRTVLCSTVDVEDSHQQNLAMVNPNPSNDYLMIHTLDNTWPNQISIVNTLGQPVMIIDNYYDGQKVDCKGLVAGTYTILVNNIALENKLIIIH